MSVNRKIQFKFRYQEKDSNPFKPNKPTSEFGYFHGFFTQAYADGDQATSKPVAVIECEDGEVKVVHAEEIRFVNPPEN